MVRPYKQPLRGSISDIRARAPAVIHDAKAANRLSGSFIDSRGLSVAKRPKPMDITPQKSTTPCGLLSPAYCNAPQYSDILLIFPINNSIFYGSVISFTTSL